MQPDFELHHNAQNRHHVDEPEGRQRIKSLRDSQSTDVVSCQNSFEMF